MLTKEQLPVTLLQQKPAAHHHHHCHCSFGGSHHWEGGCLELTGVVSLRNFIFSVSTGASLSASLSLVEDVAEGSCHNSDLSCERNVTVATHWIQNQNTGVNVCRQGSAHNRLQRQGQQVWVPMPFEGHGNPAVDQVQLSAALW